MIRKDYHLLIIEDGYGASDLIDDYKGSFYSRDEAKVWAQEWARSSTRDPVYLIFCSNGVGLNVESRGHHASEWGVRTSSDIIWQDAKLMA